MKRFYIHCGGWPISRDANRRARALLWASGVHDDVEVEDDDAAPVQLLLSPLLSDPTRCQSWLCRSKAASAFSKKLSLLYLFIRPTAGWW